MQTGPPQMPTPPTRFEDDSAALESAPQLEVLPDEHRPSSVIEGMRRRSDPGTGPSAAHWLALMLDEVHHGMLLVDAQARLLHANHAARAECDAGHPLQLRQGRLLARQAQDQARLGDALKDARSGRRKLLTLGRADRPVSLAVIPLDLVDAQATLLVLGKRQAFEALSLQGFAACHALTPAETRVLAGLCEGLRARELARRHGVSLDTVRSQIGSMRAKTGAKSIAALVRQVAVLPPLLGSLRTPA